MWRSLGRKLGRSVENRGVAGTLALIPTLAVSELQKSINSLRPGVRRARTRDRLFDQNMGIETHGKVVLSALRIDSGNQLFGVQYQPTPPADFEALMKKVPVDRSRFTFIDIGSGKGRTLFLAACYPFARVIGVEFSPELCEVAERNTARFLQHPQRRCEAVQTICADATAYDFPEQPTIIYMFNPFQAKVMAPVLRNLEASLEAHPRELFVIYYNALNRELFDASAAFELLEGGGGPPELEEPWAIYRARRRANLATPG